ncbi:MAG: 50S ribosomal protein L4 [Bacteroidota bacterium]
MEVAIYNIEGSDTGKRIDLSDAVFSLETPNDHAIYMDVRQFLANQRQGTHKAKSRSEIHGTNKKPFRQKGTGNARQGDRKSPLFRHGGRIFGPYPRNYRFSLNKKLKTLANRSALTYKAREESIRILESFDLEVPKTKTFIEIMKKLSLENQKVLLVTGENTPNVMLSGRNLPKTKVVTAADVNTYDILNADMLVLTEDAVPVIHERLEK